VASHILSIPLIFMEYGFLNHAQEPRTRRFDDSFRFLILPFRPQRLQLTMKRFLVWLLLLDPSNGSYIVRAATEGTASEQRGLMPSSWAEITFDTFEDGGGIETWGSYEAGGGQARLEDKSHFDGIFASTFSAVVRDDKAPPDSSFFHKDSHDVSLFDDLKIHFWFYSDHMKDFEHEFLIEYSTEAGGPWNIVETINRFSDKVPLEKTITFSIDAPEIDVQSMSGIKLRFRCDGKDSKTKVYVDQIRFEGHLADIEPSPGPSVTPSATPTRFPSASPSSNPSPKPSKVPSAVPTAAPSSEPSFKDPTSKPSTNPSVTPTMLPSSSPSVAPSTVSSQQPSNSPAPSLAPSATPSSGPTLDPSASPTDTLTRDDICPVDRLYPPSKYEILQYTPEVSTSGVEDDLAEISSLTFSDQTDEEGNLYAYVASDKNQFSIKVIRFQRHAETGQVVMGNATTVATYALDVHYSNSDWEDISLGPCSSASNTPTCLYIGNFGNNNRGGGYVQRSVLKIFKFPEPIWWTTTGPSDLLDVPVTTIMYRYAAPGFNESVYYDAEAMFVDWQGGKGDIYIITKGRCGTGRVGVIPASYHETLSIGNAPSTIDVPDGAYIYPMTALMLEPPKQGDDITCGESPFRLWQGADMRRDGRLIALITGESPPRVYFYPRLAEQSVLEALTSNAPDEAASCPFIAPTSYGLEDERKHEAVAFMPDGKGFADTSECNGGSACEVPIYFWDLLFPDSPDTTFSDGLVPASDDGEWVSITDDDFETGDHLGSFVNGTRAFASQAYACPLDATDSNNWSIHINEHKGPDSAIAHKEDQDASTYMWLKVEFDFLLDGFDHMDALFLELSLDGGATYFIVADWAKDTQGISALKSCYMKNTVVLNAGDFSRSHFGSQVRLRFRTSANAQNDRVYIDNILFQGHG
jgi:hypothetical protein